jgi:heptosyltransferase-1
MVKILVIKTSSLGDIIQTYPTLSYLRSKFPHGQIDWIVESPCAELIQAHPHINSAFLINTKSWRRSLFNAGTFKEIGDFRQRLRAQVYDVIFDLQGNLKSGMILSQARGKDKVGFGWRSVPEWPNLLFTNRRFNPAQNSKSDKIT